MPPEWWQSWHFAWRMGATSFAKVICGCVEFATEAVCAFTLVATSVAKARITTGSSFLKGFMTLPPGPAGNLLPRCFPDERDRTRTLRTVHHLTSLMSRSYRSGTYRRRDRVVERPGAFCSAGILPAVAVVTPTSASRSSRFALRFFPTPHREYAAPPTLAARYRRTHVGRPFFCSACMLPAVAVVIPTSA